MTERLRNSSDVLNEVRVEHRGFAILRILSRLPGYGANDLLMGDLLKVIGLGGSQAETGSLLQDLQAKGLVRLNKVEKIVAIELTAKGSEAAEGFITVDGVLRPPPDCPY